MTNLYGVLNQERRDLPYPTALVIDRGGTVRYRRQDVDFTRRPPASELLAAVRALPK